MHRAPLVDSRVTALHPEAGEPETLEARMVSVGRGDESAFADLYDRVAPRVYGLVLRILKDVHQSEEVTQEVLLQLWQTSDQFDPARGSVLSWVMTMAHRRAVDRVRSAASSRRRDATDAVRTFQAPVDVTADAAQASLEAATVRTALATLSRPQRQALELAYFGGHTHGEVSLLLGIPLGTAKTRIRDGLIRLRDTLTPVAELA